MSMPNRAVELVCQIFDSFIFQLSDSNTFISGACLSTPLRLALFFDSDTINLMYNMLLVHVTVSLLSHRSVKILSGRSIKQIKLLCEGSVGQ